MGSRGADRYWVGFNGASSRFEVWVAGGAAVSGLCRRANSSGSRINCPANRNNLNGLTISTGDGETRSSCSASIPATMTTKIDGGNGRNVIQGGRSKDLIETSTSSAGSVLKGDGGLDIIYANDRVRVMGGGDTDISRVVNPCRGATLDGGPGTDSVVFAGPHARRGVKADLGRGYAQWRSGGCAARTDIRPDIEKLEGTDGNDYLIVGRRHRPAGPVGDIRPRRSGPVRRTKRAQGHGHDRRQRSPQQGQGGPDRQGDLGLRPGRLLSKPGISRRRNSGRFGVLSKK